MVVLLPLEIETTEVREAAMVRSTEGQEQTPEAEFKMWRSGCGSERLQYF